MTDWTAILREHGPAVWGTVYRLLDHNADASDCYQEVFVAAWQFTERQPVHCWRAFLITLATRRAMDKLRQRYMVRSRFTEIDAIQQPPSQRSSPLEQIVGVELLDRVRAEMAALPDKQAEVFWLSCIEEMPQREISERMEIPFAEIRVLLHRARCQLRAVFEPERVDHKEI